MGTLSDDPALAGVRVVDLTQLLPGPLCTLKLAEAGAEVLKVEPPGGDPMRQLGPLHAGRSVLFDLLNAGKTMLTLDLKQAADRSRLDDLLDAADVLVEGFRPGVLDRLGYGWTTLHARYPRLVLCSITGYGQTGEHALLAGHDINYLAAAGVLAQMQVDGRPAMPNLQIADILGGAMPALAGILAALLAVQRTGVGRHVDISMTASVRALHVIPRAWRAAGLAVPASGADLLTGGTACYNLYRTADEAWLVIGALELKFWQRVCAVLGQPEHARAHWSLGEMPGSPAALQTIAATAARVAAYPRAHWQAAFAGQDCCVSVLAEPGAGS